MSYNGETIKDEALEKYTLGLMEDVVRHYHDRLDEYNVDKLIERGISKQLVEWIPEKYTEVDIKALIGSKYTSVIAEFMTDMQTMMVVVHEEVNSVEKKQEFNTPEERLVAFKKRHGKHPMAQFNGYDDDGNYMPEAMSVDYINPSEEFHAKCRAYDAARTKAVDEGIVVDSIIPTEDMYKPRGSKVETLPKGDESFNLGLPAGYKQQLLDKIKKAKVPEATWKPDAGYTRGIVEQLSSAHTRSIVEQAHVTPAGIDFSTISGINPSKAQDWNRNTDSQRSTYYSIDTNAALKESIVEMEKESMIYTAKMRLQELAEQVSYDAMTSTTAAAESATKPLTMAELQEAQEAWNCGTSGWSREYTNAMFDDLPKIEIPKMDKDDFSWKVPAEMTWYNPYSLTSYDSTVVNTAMEEISFSKADLGELIDLVNEVQSEVMKFE